MSKPVLSIGMIFKNEIRCLERCMKSLAPLREAVPCELVMADTGSGDGSREIAEKYADILFDFPWVDDFSAARNAVMDRCSGVWHMFIDCDEWLDGDFSELVEFLRLPEKKNKWAAGAVTVRNYRSYDEAERDTYTDGMPIRLLRVSTGLRFEGVIHESWILSRQQEVIAFSHVIFHHDGYVCLNDGTGQEKRARNLSLLRTALAQEPEDLRRIQEYIEASGKEADHLEYIRRGMSLVEKKCKSWELHGPPIFRSAVFSGQELDLPETDEWIRRAEELFPDAFTTRLDVEHVAFGRSVERKDRAECVRRGERWLVALDDYRSGRGARIGMLYGAIQSATPDCEAYVRVFTANAYLLEGNPGRAWELLEEMDGSRLEAERAGNFIFVLQRLHAATDFDTKPLLLRFWGQMNAPVPTKERADGRKKEFLENAAKSFLPAYLKKEAEDGYLRRAYTLYTPLAGDCEIGIGAAILGSVSAREMEELLSGVERWDALPPLALEKALASGARFPPPGRALKLEEMDMLAGRLDSPRLAVRAADDNFTVDWQSLLWARGLVLAGVQSCPWDDEETGLKLARAFAKIEREFLPRYYVSELLCEENIGFLPPMHRFGWYCARAFDALDGGDAVQYVRLLQKGLASCENMKNMVEFLADHTPELQPQKPSGELLELAEKVRIMLSAYPPDDPAVMMIKQSPVYQKVAHLIEGPEVGLFGGLAQ